LAHAAELAGARLATARDLGAVKTTDETTNKAMNLLFDLFERERLSEAQGSWC
jgi:hypothetical protein